MTELEMIRELLPDAAGPAQTTIRTAEKLLAAEIAGGSRPRRRYLSYGLGAVAVGAAAAGAVAVIGSGSPGPSRAPTATGSGGTSVQKFLLAAAETAAKEPVGRYWRVLTIGGQSYHVGPANGGYTMVGYRDETDRWTARSMTDPDTLYTRDLGARPLTAADAAAWRRAGSPTTVRVWSNDHYTTLSTTPGRTYGTVPGGWGSSVTTPAQKKKIAMQSRCPPGDKACEFAAPIDPRTLTEQKLRQYLFWPNPTVKGVDAERVLNTLDFLTQRPVTPQMRAAAYRLLAQVPGIRWAGTVKDALGRSGIGLAARQVMREAGQSVIDVQIILDPQTHKVLGYQQVIVKAGGADRGMAPGTILYSEVYLQAGWTDARPHHP